MLTCNQVEEFLKIAADDARCTIAEPGCDRFDFLRDPSCSNKFTFCERPARRSRELIQLILWLASAVSNEGRSSPLLVPLPPFLGPGFRLGARWNRLGQAVKTRKKREKTGKKWARYGLRSVNQGS